LHAVARLDGQRNVTDLFQRALQRKIWSDASPWATTRTARRRTGYEPTREAAMEAFAKSWRRE